jgi:hypothetical protein
LLLKSKSIKKIMKRSKIFLGLTTAVLATVGLFAAKSAKFNSLQYKVRSGTGVCSAALGPIQNATYNGSTVLTTGSSAHAIAYTAVTTSCTQPLFIGQ